MRYFTTILLSLLLLANPQYIGYGSQDLPTLSFRTSIEALHPALKLKLKGIIRDMRSRGWEPVIASGCRTIEAQREKVRQGYSKTMNSRHIIQKDGYCRAVDLIDRRYGWNEKYITEIKAYRRDLGAILKGMDYITWGGNWRGFGYLGDWAHIQYDK